MKQCDNVSMRMFQHVNEIMKHIYRSFLHAMSWVQLADTMVPLLKTSEQTNVPAMSRVALKVMEA